MGKSTETLTRCPVVYEYGYTCAWSGLVFMLVIPCQGKLFTPNYMTQQRVAALYPELPKFVELCKAHDPDGKFRNGKLLLQSVDSMHGLRNN